jgi:WS/DGAT/MGAT family acyltransferase
MDWMSPMDASFLHIEGPNNPMHIGGVSIFEGPAPAFERLEEMVASKLDAVPRYRQKVRFVPFALGRPAWVDDPYFNLGYHLRHSALPSPGSADILRRTAARIFAQHLDRRKPLWEIWMVEGLRGNRWALLSKVHHCMVDGVSATDLMTVMFDDSPSSAPTHPWEPSPEPSGAELVLRSLTRQASDPSEQLRVVRAAMRRPRATLAKAEDVLRGMTSAVGLFRPRGRSSLTGPVGPHRTWSTAYVRLTTSRRSGRRSGEPSTTSC